MDQPLCKLTLVYPPDAEDCIIELMLNHLARGGARPRLQQGKRARARARTRDARHSHSDHPARTLGTDS